MLKNGQFGRFLFFRHINTKNQIDLYMTEKIYADYEVGSNDMFVVTPEGNYFNFPAPEYTDKHAPETIIDQKSHKQYTVVFSE